MLLWQIEDVFIVDETYDLRLQLMIIFIMD